MATESISVGFAMPYISSHDCVTPPPGFFRSRVCVCVRLALFWVGLFLASLCVA